MMKFSIITLIAATLFLAACEDPAANKPEAKLAEPATSPAERTEPQQERRDTERSVKGEALSISKENSRIEFVGSKVTGKHDGGFNSFTGMIDLVDGKAEGSTVTIEIDMDSVFTDAEGLTEHLKTADFFEVEKYSKSYFKITKIEPDTDKGADNYNVTGDLELRGVKKAVTFPAVIKVNESLVEVSSEFSINRKDFGIVYAGKADDLIRDRVLIRLELKSSRKKQ